MQNAFFAADAQTKDLGGGCRRRVLAHNGDIMIVEVLFEAGAVGAAHSHPHTQATYVRCGAFRFAVDGREITVGAGDSLVFASGQEHGTVCLEEGCLIDVFTPQRDDFL